jgi:hypothetical protein
VSAGLSVFLGVCGLLFVGFGEVGGAAAAAGGSLLFGVVALAAGARGGWRRAALIGISFAGLALVVFALLLVATLGLS